MIFLSSKIVHPHLFVVPLLGMPGVCFQIVEENTTAAFLVPSLTCVPMGISCVVSVAQAVSMAIVRHSSISAPLLLADLVDSRVTGGHEMQLVYID